LKLANGTETAMKQDRNYMKCSEFEEIVHELDRPGTKGNELREEALIHAESCGRCGVLLTETEALDFALTRLANGADRSSPPSRVETTLLQEFRRANETAGRRRMQWRIAVIGVAAALFLALGISLQRFYSPAQGLGGASQANLAKSIGETGRSVSESPQKIAQNKVQSDPAAPQVGTQAADSTDENEFAEDFTPLPYADDPSMMEGGSIVRVVLSRSALASFGVSLSGAENREQIPADLVVSADGTPEAIRLVAQSEN
jgi:hypothetical protein